MMTKRRGLRTGFTLVEMIVSLAVFSVVAVVALTALMSIMDANRKAQTLQSAMTNLNYALESISREMRVGNTYNCVSGTSFNKTEISSPADNINCYLLSTTDPTAGAMLAFNSSRSAMIGAGPDSCSLITAYRFVPLTGRYAIEKALQTTCGSAIDDSLSPPSDFSSIIDDEVVITGYNIRVMATTPPYVIIRISGYVGEREKDRTYFDVQTGISGR